MITINKVPKIEYAEITQQISSVFSFVNKVSDTKYNELFYPVRCRDFLGDACWSNVTKKKVATYGFTFDPEVSSLDEDATLLHVCFSKKEDAKFFESNISFLHGIEVDNKINLSRITKIQYMEYLLEGDSFWQKTPWLISLYTLIIRCLSYPDWEKIIEKETNEARYLKSIGADNWKKLTANLRKIVKVPCTEPSGWELNMNQDWISQLHNASGAVNIFCPNVRNNKYSTFFQTLQ